MTDLVDNPLMTLDHDLRFADFRPEHVVPAMTTLLDRTEKALDELEQNPGSDWDGIMGRLEQIWEPVNLAWGVVGHLNAVRNSPALRAAHETMQPRLVETSLRSNQSRPIYDALKSLRESDAFATLDAPRQRLLNKEIQEAELAGVGLDGAAKKRFNEIASELSRLTTRFSNNVLDATKAYELIVRDPADAAGWPVNLRAMASASYNTAYPDALGDPQHGPWRITLDAPSSGAFLRHSRNQAQREAVYLAQITRASDGEFDNRELLRRIIDLRIEQAHLLGFETYAQLSLATKMAQDTATIRSIAKELADVARPVAEQDFDELKRFVMEQGESPDMKLWDVAFWTERLREKQLAYTDDQVRPYFAFDTVLAGLFTLCNRLFGIRFKEDTASVQVWHPDVRFYRVLDEAQQEIASFYLDPYSRPAEKQGGAWMNPAVQRRQINGAVRNPIVYIVCNSTPPTSDTPSLMGFNEVTTLFHEFGHALHGLLTQVDEARLSGIFGVEWDAVELPSQFMENWCYHRPTLQGLAQHWQTGAPLPDELLEKLLASRIFRAAGAMLGQLAFLEIDLALYDGFDPNGPEAPLTLQQRILAAHSVLPPHPRNAFLCSFTHIFCGGYAAGYYSYKWAEVLSADAFAAFEVAGLDNPDAVARTGRRFRDTILAQGGSEHPMALFQRFRGREPRTDALLRHNGLVQNRK